MLGCIRGLLLHHFRVQIVWPREWQCSHRPALLITARLTMEALTMEALTMKAWGCPKLSGVRVLALDVCCMHEWPNC